MKCAQCESKGLKSRVIAWQSTVTIVDSYQVYDEEGEPIKTSKNPNVETQHYSCTNGHHFSTKNGKLDIIY